MCARAQDERDGGSRPRERARRDRAEVPSARSELAPTARRLLEAARRLLERQGYEALTLEAIGREAGENKSLIWYHFGGKPGILVALADWILYEQLRELRGTVDEMPPGPERQALTISHARELASDSEAYRLFFALLPHLERDRGTRRRLAALYADYRKLNAQGLSLQQESSRDASVLAAMMVALADGLAIQLLLDPGSVDMDRVVSLWQNLVQATLGGGDEATFAG